MECCYKNILEYKKKLYYYKCLESHFRNVLRMSIILLLSLLLGRNSTLYFHKTELDNLVLAKYSMIYLSILNHLISTSFKLWLKYIVFHLKKVS